MRSAVEGALGSGGAALAATGARRRSTSPAPGTEPSTNCSSGAPRRSARCSPRSATTNGARSRSCSRRWWRAWPLTDPRRSPPVASATARPAVASPAARSATQSEVHAEVLDVEVLLEPMAPTLAAVPRSLDPSEGRLHPAERAVVDSHHAVVERLANPVGAAQVACEQVRGEAVLGGVGELDRLVL